MFVFVCRYWSITSAVRLFLTLFSLSFFSFFSPSLFLFRLSTLQTRSVLVSEWVESASRLPAVCVSEHSTISACKKNTTWSHKGFFMFICCVCCDYVCLLCCLLSLLRFSFHLDVLSGWGASVSPRLGKATWPYLRQKSCERGERDPTLAASSLPPDGGGGGMDLAACALAQLESANTEQEAKMCILCLSS